jgi:imidazoleglycerol phosphate synthase glutamine amidotransferase subunit HisH
MKGMGKRHCADGLDDAVDHFCGSVSGMPLSARRAWWDEKRLRTRFFSGVRHHPSKVFKVPHMGWNSITWFPVREHALSCASRAVLLLRSRFA